MGFVIKVWESLGSFGFSGGDKEVLSKDGCKFVLVQAGDGFLSVGFGSFVEIH